MFIIFLKNVYRSTFEEIEDEQKESSGVVPGIR